MKKILLTFVLILIANVAFASPFEDIPDMTEEQKVVLQKLYDDYEKEFSTLEQKFVFFTNKLENIKNADDKTKEQIEILSSAYERNLIVLKNMQEILLSNLEEKYKEILTENQYNRYKMKKNKIQDTLEEVPEEIIEE